MKRKAAKVISIFSCKGGVGKTTNIINLAGVYSLMDKNVLIMDFDLNSGGVAASLNVDVKKTLYNVVDDMSNNRLDAKYIPIIISSCMYKYDVILIDTSHNLSPITLSILDNSDNTLFMITNDPIDLKNSRSMISVFKDNDKTNYKVVFNSSKDTGKDYYSLFDVKNIIRHNIDYTIDRTFYIKDIDKYVINGQILTLDKKIRARRSKDVMRLTKIANSLLEDNKSKVEVIDNV